MSGGSSRFERWLAIAADVATALGIVVGIIVLLATREQLKDARKTAESMTVYSIQKDARDMITALRQKKAVFDFITDYNPTNNYPVALRQEADFEIGQLVQFHSAVFNQHRNGVITDRYWSTFEQNIRNFMSFAPVSAYWTNNVLKGGYNEEFKQFGRRIFQR